MAGSAGCCDLAITSRADPAYSVMVCVVFGAETERASPLFFISADRHHRALKHNEDEDDETDNDGGPFGRHTEVRGERIEDGAEQESRARSRARSRSHR